MGDGDSAFPRAVEQIDAAWLTRALREGGHAGAPPVKSVRTEQIGEGVGFLGEIHRLSLEYDEDAAGAPATLIAKLATKDPVSRGLAAMFGFYRCEVNFYRHIAAEISLRTPRCYFSALSADGSEFALLFEDLGATGRLGDQVKGCTREEAELALTQIAPFHAEWWGSPRLDELTWLPKGLDLARQSFTHLYPHGWRACLERYGDLLPPGVRDAAPTLNERVLRMLDDLDTGPVTIAHTDYRLDNMFFGAPGSDYKLAVFDWQIANRGGASFDVAYFISGSLDTEVRRSCEMDLLRAYHDALLAQGVRDYSWDDLVLDYRRIMILMLANTIGGVASLNTTNERGVMLFELLFRRVSAAVSDLDSLELLLDA